ncbi:putative pentatricopeptide repeat-containing protein At3g01580 isoform X1 [Silene latifolia]|uniref:putative pentatricopeptide repeat-containing protein At3g01580 isoform X1 n=1 Tax=Silene latifolia TaxID=37657 RepID=UPI003D76A730
MGSVQLSEVLVPQFQYNYAYRHSFYIEQCRILPLCRSTRYDSVYCNFKHKKNTISVQNLHNCRKLMIECCVTKEDGFCNEMEGDQLIMDLTSKGLYADAVTCYIDMLNSGFIPIKFVSFPALIKAVGALSDLELTRQINGNLIKVGAIKDIYVANSLVSAFWKCGAANDSVRMFMKMEDRDLVSWNTMISGFHHSGLFHKSLELFTRMISEFGIYPNRVACLSALSSCASLKSRIHGREIHAYVIKSELAVDEYVLNGLLDMYMKCSSVGNAEKLFEISLEHARKNTVLWNVMVSGYMDNGNFLKAVLCFIQMLFLQIKPDSSTVVALLVLCSKSIDLGLGKQIHVHAMKMGLEMDVRVGTALMDMYFKCANPGCGLKLFDRFDNHNIVMWGTIITNCTRSGYSRKALDLCVAGFKHGFMDHVILLAVLRACSALTIKPEGMMIHGLSVKLGLDSEIYIGSALIDMYMKCQDIASGQKAFLRLPLKDEISWSNLISGYAQNELWADALKAFSEMHCHEIRPNAVIIACMLSICACVFGNLKCKEIHGYIIRNGFETNTLVNNALIVAYAKTGNMESPRRVFSLMEHKDEVSWNSILLGLGLHGNSDEMLVFFDKMRKAGLKPDHQTFTAVLSACSHTGRVTDGLNYFRSMVEEHMLEPRIEQYTCLVDLLGRAGYLDEAYDLIMAMPYNPDDRIWGSLLASCRIYGNEKLAECVAKNIFELDPTSIGYRVLLSNLYEDSCKLNEVAKVRSKVKDMGLKKSPGCSWIEVDNHTHVFTASDQSHHQADDIYTFLNTLTLEMKRDGYIPQL